MLTKSLLINYSIVALFQMATGISYGQFGPGGVGNTTGTSSLKIWYSSSFGVVTTGANINSVTNRAGIAALNISETGAFRPILVPTALNGFPEISFSGANRLRTGLTLTTSNFVNDEATTFLVNRANNTTQTSCVYTTDPLVTDRFTNHVPWAGTVYYDIGSCCGTNARLEVSGLAGLTNYSFWTYDAHPTTGKSIYRNGTLLQNRALTSTYTGHATQRFNLGGNTGGSNGFEGDLTEVIVYTTAINSTQRIIVENYLAAKYGLASSANDLYVQDNPSNGNYDFDVAGIGRTTSTNLHTDSQGTGIVRILNPANLGNNEFFIWGHNNAPLGTFGSTDFAAPLQGRWFREWRVNEVNASGAAIDIGAIDIRFDLTGMGSVTASDLRLLVDTDNDGVFNDEVPIAGATGLGGNIYQFSGVTAIENNMRFTLGTINKFGTPLPIELINFEAKTDFDNSVLLKWQTASETNNDYFTIQKLKDGENWIDVAKIDGAGNSTSLLSYSTIDSDPFAGLSYYRLKQTDFNGAFSYSAVKSVIVKEKQQLKLNPNPAENYLIVQGRSSDLRTIKIIDSTGKDLTSLATFKNEFDSITIDLHFFENGIYFLQTAFETKKFIKQ